MTRTATAPANGKSNKPAHELRIGRIKAVIWLNVTENGPRYNTCFTRLYRDGDTWKDSNSFGRDDLPLLRKVADRAHDWIFEQSTHGAGQGDDQE